MSFRITPVINKEDEKTVTYVTRQVFCAEMGVPVARLKLPENSNTLKLVAWDELTAQPAASLTLLDTSGDTEMRTRYGLDFDHYSRSVRYTQLAILKPYRGLKLSIRLILAGYRLLVEPGRYDYSWLMFNARRASASSLCRLLKYTPSLITVDSEMGRSRALVRNESSPECKEAIRQAEAFLEEDVEMIPLLKKYSFSA